MTTKYSIIMPKFQVIIKDVRRKAQLYWICQFPKSNIPTGFEKWFQLHANGDWAVGTGQNDIHQLLISNRTTHITQ